MKNINLFAFLLFTLLVGSACLDDTGELADTSTFEAATIAVDPGGSVIRNVTTDITIPIVLTEMSDPGLIQSVDVMLNFTGVNNTVSDMKVASLTSLPGEVSFTMEELLSQSGLTLEELNAGDAWSYSFLLNNRAGSIWQTANDTRYTFTCPSSLAGMYDAVSSGSSTDVCCPDPYVDFTATIELTEERSGVYNISDFSGGIYLDWYDTYGLSGDSPGRLEHICSKIKVIETTEPFGTPVIGQGTYDDATGVITYDWANGYGDTGTVTLTPQ